MSPTDAAVVGDPDVIVTYRGRFVSAGDHDATPNRHEGDRWVIAHRPHCGRRASGVVDSRPRSAGIRGLSHIVVVLRVVIATEREHVGRRRRHASVAIAPLRRAEDRTRDQRKGCALRRRPPRVVVRIRIPPLSPKRDKGVRPAQDHNAMIATRLVKRIAIRQRRRDGPGCDGLDIVEQARVEASGGDHGGVVQYRGGNAAPRDPIRCTSQCPIQHLQRALLCT